MATTGASLNPILERLQGEETHHPMDAETFSDWSMEAGDKITVSRDGKEYTGPVHTATMTWKGKAPTISINSVGKQERDSVAKKSQQKYRSSSGGLRNDKNYIFIVEDKYSQLSSGLVLTASSAILFSKSKYDEMRSGLSLTASSAILYATNKYSEMSTGLKLTASSAVLYATNKYSEMSTGLKLTASSAVLYATNKYTEMSTGLKLTASSAVLYASNKYTEMSTGLRLTASSAVLYATNKYDEMSTGLRLTASSAVLYATNKYSEMSTGLSLTASSAVLYATNKYSEMSTGLNLTASSAVLYATNKYTEMSTGLSLTASSAVLYAHNKYNDMKTGLELTASSMTLYSNTVNINASRINMNATGTIKMSDVLGVNASGFLTVAGDTYQNGTLYTSNVGVAAGGHVNFIEGTAPPVNVELTGSDVKTMIVKAEVDQSTNTLKLWTHGEDTSQPPALTFSKATSLSGEWSGSVAGGKSYKVTATQSGTTVGTAYSPAMDMIYFTGNKTWSADYKSFQQMFRIMDENGTDLYEQTLNLDTTDSWTAGRNSVSHNPTIDYVGTSSSVPSGGEIKQSIVTEYERAKSDGDYLVIRVNCNGTRKTYYCEP